MAKHADRSTGDGQVNYDPAKSKDVREAGGGRHSSEDRGDPEDQGHEDDEAGGEQ